MAERWKGGGVGRLGTGGGISERVESSDTSSGRPAAAANVSKDSVPCMTCSGCVLVVDSDCILAAFLPVGATDTLNPVLLEDMSRGTASSSTTGPWGVRRNAGSFGGVRPAFALIASSYWGS